VTTRATDNAATGQPVRKRTAWLWVGLALVLLLSVTIINRGPLYYYDSSAYVDNGAKLLEMLGIQSAPDHALPVAGGGEALGDKTVNGSRSVFYSLFSSVFSVLMAPISLAFAQAILTLVVGLLTYRVISRAMFGRPDRSMSNFTLSIAIAAFSSLPFYVAYFMPDILTVPMILCTGLVAAFWRQMRFWEIALAFIIATTGVLSHPSHPVMLALLVPFVVLATVLADRRAWWVPVAFSLAILGVAGAERVAFSFAAKETLDAEVIYYPFLTARLIEDEVGYRYLNENCPNEAIATCALAEALSWSDDPYRLTASHIIFESDKKLGSFKLMEPQDQQRVANSQVSFAVDVFKAYPLATIGTVIGNTLEQANMNSIKMTIPQAGVARSLGSLDVNNAEDFRLGTLRRDQSWLPIAERVQEWFYLACLIVLAAMMVWPGLLSPQIRVFVLFVTAGVLINAFVCGAVSQPADRYGARVIWVLPYLTATLAVLLVARHNRIGTPQ